MFVNQSIKRYFVRNTDGACPTVRTDSGKHRLVHHYAPLWVFLGRRFPWSSTSSRRAKGLSNSVEYSKTLPTKFPWPESGVAGRICAVITSAGLFRVAMRTRQKVDKMYKIIL